MFASSCANSSGFNGGMHVEFGIDNDFHFLAPMLRVVAVEGFEAFFPRPRLSSGELAWWCIQIGVVSSQRASFARFLAVALKHRSFSVATLR
jgi:hypothetical protein